MTNGEPAQALALIVAPAGESDPWVTLDYRAGSPLATDENH